MEDFEVILGQYGDKTLAQRILRFYPPKPTKDEIESEERAINMFLKKINCPPKQSWKTKIELLREKRAKEEKQAKAYIKWNKAQFNLID